MRKIKGDIVNKLIITAAITGSRITRAQTPYIPITPEEIVQSAIESWSAGASIVHIHVRNPETGVGCQDLSLFEAVVKPLREKTDLILCLTTSGIPGKNLPTHERLAPLSLKPELASFDAGSINLGNDLFANPPDFLEEAARQMKKAGVKPELEVFDLGMVMTCLRMAQEGKIDSPLHFQLVLGTPYGAPATPKAFLHIHEHLPENATWSVLGAGKGGLPMAMMAIIMGGHVRVGMEDAIYFRKNELATSNAQFVTRISKIAKEYDRDTATPAEARKILGLV
jgi:3-keto-5-aminohexanoate cleavage enzyme